MKITAIIPARYHSSRFPGKPLVEIRGRSMISRVAARVCELLPRENVVVATDDERIFRHVETEGFRVVMTSDHHLSGTDRCAEAARLLSCKDEDIILNVQGDEPYIRPEQLSELITCFDDSEVQIGTLVRMIEDEHDLKSPNIVKVVRNLKGDAMLFSRSVIPFDRAGHQNPILNGFTYLAHIGLYGFRMSVLQKLCQLPESALEKTEMLEQLRWLEHGYGIRAVISKYPSWAVDTPDDLGRLPEE